jgi:hypothetical protein
MFATPVPTASCRRYRAALVPALLTLGSLVLLAADGLAQQPPGSDVVPPLEEPGLRPRSAADRLKEAGGSARSEAAVALGLKWLALH